MTVQLSQEFLDAALRIALCSQRILTMPDVFFLSDLSPTTYPFQRTTAGYPTNAPSKKAVTRTPITRIAQACQAVFSKTDGVIKYTVHEHGRGPPAKACSLTISRPEGSERTYLTKPEHARNKDAESAAAQFALEMGAIDFIQRGDEGDKEALERARANKDGVDEGDESVIHTIWGQVYVNMKPSDDANYIEAINRCCQLATQGKVAPFWGEIEMKVLDPKARTSVMREYKSLV